MANNSNGNPSLSELLTPAEFEEIRKELGCTKQGLYAALKRRRPSHPGVKLALAKARASGALDTARDLNALSA